MKKLIIFGLLTLNLMASDFTLGIGINTSHVEYGHGKGDYSFNEDNNLVALEYKKIGVMSFKNSFGNDSLGVYYKYDKKLNKRFNLVLRGGIVKGYNQIDTIKSNSDSKLEYYFNNYNVLYKDYGLFGTVGIEYKVNSKVSLESDILSNAVVSSVKYRF